MATPTQIAGRSRQVIADEAASSLEQWGITLTDDTPQGRRAFLAATASTGDVEGVMRERATLDGSYGDARENWRRAAKYLRPYVREACSCGDEFEPADGVEAVAMLGEVDTWASQEFCSRSPLIDWEDPRTSPMSGRLALRDGSVLARVDGLWGLDR